MSYVKESVVVGGKEISIETGKWAKQAAGAVVVRLGDTMVLVTAGGSRSPREGMDFLPLTCEYQEKFYAAGRIPGSYFRREGRPAESEILVARLMDRPSRPLFPKGWRIDTQLIANVVSFDRENAADVLSMTGASAALHLSDLVWEGPFAGIRIGRVGGEFVAYPTFAEREESEIDIIVAATRDAIVMVEGEMTEVAEPVVVDALLFAHEALQPLLDLQEKLRAAAGKPKRAYTPPVKDEALAQRVKQMAWARIQSAMAIREKHARYEALDSVGTEVVAELCGEAGIYTGRDKEVGEAVSAVKKEFARTHTLETRTRIDGRRSDQIRPISCEVGVLPRVHGSALFTRGETQALVAVTLGTKYDEQRLDTLLGEKKKPFLLHYNFPPFSTGEV
ncbi:MAG TPA: polyribonucleotide nucleotidyltransferase, partial [Candidatus Acidoferrum sp.]|nr:polyribonucleotide nucleotidyltransferase [Candidatus Acidoferrum sp.]